MSFSLCEYKGTQINSFIRNTFILKTTLNIKKKIYNKKFVNLYIFSIGMNYEGIGLYVERLFTSRNGIVFFGLNKTTRTTFNL